MRPAIAIWVVLHTTLVLLTACSDDGSPGPDAGPDADSDADSDSDTDSDTDADTDTDTDSDTDSDSDSDTGTDTVTETETATDTATDTGTDTGTSDVNPPPDGELLAPPYLMWVTDDAVSVRFESLSETVGTVDYGTAELDQSLSESAPVQVHELRLEGLDPDTWYSYQVSFGEWSLPVESFLTAPETATEDPIDFVVWGDNQAGSGTFAEIVGLMDGEAPLFAASVGDMVQDGTRENYRQQLLTPLGPLAGHVPFLAAMGNHALYLDPDGLLFDEYLSQPGDEHCFAWQWGGLFFLFVDTEDSISDPSPQYDCIVDNLSSSAAVDADFRIALFHKPPRIEWWVGGVLAFTEEMEAPWIREELEPLLESLDVDLVMNGHNHLYAHTPETPGGITWVTTGGGGGAIDTDLFLWNVGDWPEIETTLHEHHFVSVEVDGTAMTVRAIGLSGDAIHEFTISG